MPLAGNALECVGTAILEVKPGAGDEVLHRARDEHFAGLREGSNASAAVHCDPGELIANDLSHSPV
jgi:hypothetical protein